jgi:hypothetical protein
MLALVTFGRRLAVAAGAVVLLGSTVFAPTVAAASDRTFLSMSSQPGDWVGQGQTYYITPTTASFKVTYNGSLIYFWIVEPGNGEWWGVNIAAAPGQPLLEGSYSNAVRAAFRGAGQPGLDVYGDGRGCNEVAGSFNVLRAVYGPNNTVLAFDATFVQYCEGWMPPLTGEVRYDATPALTVNATINATGTVRRSSGKATIGGTVTCSLPVTATVSGTVTEPVKKGPASASFSVQVACSGSPTAWSVTLASTSGRSFAAGTAQVSVLTSAADAFSGQQVTTSTAGPVQLTLVK